MLRDGLLQAVWNGDFNGVKEHWADFMAGLRADKPNHMHALYFYNKRDLLYMTAAIHSSEEIAAFVLEALSPLVDISITTRTLAYIHQDSEWNSNPAVHIIAGLSTVWQLDSNITLLVPTWEKIEAEMANAKNFLKELNYRDCQLDHMKRILNVKFNIQV